MARPAARHWVSRSPNHSHATTAAHSGAVALTIEAKPAVSESSAQAINTKGNAELRMPTTVSGQACSISSRHCPRQMMIGSKNRAANSTRMKISPTGPKSGAAWRMNRKLAPHSAARMNNSTVSRGRMRGLQIE